MYCNVEVESALNEPFDWLHNDAWTWLADHSEPHEYSELDSIYRYLKKEIPRNDLPDDVLELTDDRLRAEYGKRFPVVLGRTLQSIGQYIQDGELKIIIDFD